MSHQYGLRRGEREVSSQEGARGFDAERAHAVLAGSEPSSTREQARNRSKKERSARARGQIATWRGDEVRPFVDGGECASGRRSSSAPRAPVSTSPSRRAQVADGACTRKCAPSASRTAVVRANRRGEARASKSGRACTTERRRFNSCSAREGSARKGDRREA